MSSKSQYLKDKIRTNAEEINRLHLRVKEARKLRDKSPNSTYTLKEWQNASHEFDSLYDQLAFPNGYEGACNRIKAGDLEAMEAAICFLECRPYFFRSGYMFKEIFKKAKRAPLSTEQTARLQIIIEQLAEWKKQNNSQ